MFVAYQDILICEEFALDVNVEAVVCSIKQKLTVFSTINNIIIARPLNNLPYMTAIHILCKTFTQIVESYPGSPIWIARDIY